MANLTLKLMLAGLSLAGRKKGLKDLFQLTAEAFGLEPPVLDGLSRAEMLLGYARFTRAAAERSLARGTAPSIRKDLYERSLRLGRGIRSRLPIRDHADAAAALRCVYRLLAIDMEADPYGAVTIRRCFFAAHYPAEVCRFMSAMDEGLVAGLGNGQLVFSQRLTEGADCCCARIAWADGENE